MCIQCNIFGNMQSAADSWLSYIEFHKNILSIYNKKLFICVGHIDLPPPPPPEKKPIGIDVLKIIDEYFQFRF